MTSFSFKLRSAWSADGQNFPAGALLATDFDAALNGHRAFKALFTPADRSSWSDQRHQTNYSC